MAKKMVKWLFLIIAGVIIAAAAIGIISSLPVLSMDPVETGQIDELNIYAVKNRIVNVYLVKTYNGYIMIDAGNDQKKLRSSLKEIGIGIDDVRWIFLTHSDSDHATAITMFPGAEIFMNEDELSLVNGTLKRNAFGKNKMPSKFDVYSINLLSDRQVLSCNGTSVQCIKAPGHTNGSMVYLIDGQYLFTGDAFKVKNGKLKVHPYTMDRKLAKLMIEQIQGILDTVSIVFTSHYGYYKDLP